VRVGVSVKAGGSSAAGPRYETVATYGCGITYGIAASGGMRQDKDAFYM
jgi:hypothetical protein